MKNLYIIGNGFDLHHGIQSSYWSYMNWVQTNYPELFKEIEHTFIGASKDSWWADFENGLDDVDWFYNINNISSGSAYVVGNIKITGKTSSRRLLRLYNAIQATFTQWVRHLSPQINSVAHDIIIDINARYLNFNYTSTLQHVYLVPDDNVLHIHGNALRGDKLIIGHSSNGDIFHIMQVELVDYMSDTMEMASAIGNFRKPTEKIIARYQLFFDSLTDVEQVITYGFSFSPIDMPYIIEIHRHLSNEAAWRVYVHSDRDKKRMAVVQNELNLNMELIDW